MSLTTRVFNLFSTTDSSPVDSTASTATYSKTASTGDHVFHPSPIRPGADSSVHNAPVSIDEEEEPRPPYLHVCLPEQMAGPLQTGLCGSFIVDRMGF